MPISISRRLRTLAVVLAAVAASRDATAAILDLPGGGVLPGVLLSAESTESGDRETVVWSSPVFSAPLEFHLDEIAGIRFPGTPRDLPAAAFAAVLRGGDVLEGDLESIDATHVVFRPRGSDDAVRISREVVEDVSRLGGDRVGCVGPGGLSQWRCTPEQAWRSEAGHIIASRPGLAVRQVAAPARAVYDITLSWRRRPDLRLGVAVGDDPAMDTCWVEFFRLADGGVDAAVIRHEENAAAIEPLAAGDAATKSLRIVIFVDQQRGRLAAFTVDRGVAGPVAEVTVPPEGRTPAGGFSIAVGAGDVTLESLRVGPWTAAEPVVEERATATVLRRDGSRIEGDLVSFDRSAGGLLVRGRAGETRVPLDEVDGIVMPRLAAAFEAGGAGATVRAMQVGGGSLAGRIVEIDEQAMRMRVPGVEGDVAIPLGDLASLTSLVARPEPRALPGREGTLVSGSARLRGCLVDGDGLGSALAWLPQGAVAAAPLATGTAGPDVVVEYVPRVEAEPVGAAEVEIGGIGGMVNQDAEGFFVVTMLSEDGAAAQDGRLQPGDRLLEIKPRPEGGFVPTRGHDVTTVMNLMRGRVGSPVVLRVAGPRGGGIREIALERGLIYVAGRDVLEQALAAHSRLAAVAAPEAASCPSLAILRSGDMVPCEVVGMTADSIRVRTPVVAGTSGEPVVVPAALVQAVELDPSAPGRGIERPRYDRLLMLPRSQRIAPPTHLVRLLDGDYLRGRLASLDEATLVLDVRGELKRLPRSTVARVIWLHPDPAADAPSVELPAGLLVQAVGKGRRVTLVAERLADGTIQGASPALGPGQIDVAGSDRLLVGRAIDGEADELPFRQWRLRPAPEPKALQESAPGK